MSFSVVCLLGVLVVVLYWGHRSFGKRTILCGVPQLNGYPIIGSIPFLIKHGLAGTLERLIQISGDTGLSCAWLGSTPVVCLRDPSLIREALSLPDEIMDRQGNHQLWTPLSTLRRTIGPFLFYYVGNEARSGRRAICATLTNSAVLSSKLDFMINMASKHVDIIAKEGTSTGAKRDFRQLADDFAIDMWGEVMFEMKDAHLDSHKLLAVVEKVNRIIVNPFHIIYHALRSYLSFKRFDQPDYIERKIYRDVESIMSSRISYLEALEQNGKPEHNILRNVAIATGGEACGPLNQHAIDLARFNIYGGHHSIGLIITWLFYELNRNPQNYNRVRKEAMALLEGDGTSGLNLTSLRTRTPYLDAVIKEIMRIYPIVHATVRVVNKKCTLSSTRGEPVPLTPGMVVYVSFYHLHRSEEYWGQDAAQFRPERFLAGKPTEGKFMPFGLGTRSCVGYEFPMLSIKVFLVLLLAQYSVDMQDFAQTVKFGAMLEPCKPFEFSVKKLE